jgi:hypothetical protein
MLFYVVNRIILCNKNTKIQSNHVFFFIIINGSDEKDHHALKQNQLILPTKNKIIISLAQLFYLLLQCTKASNLSLLVIICMNTEAKLQDSSYTTNHYKKNYKSVI